MDGEDNRKKYLSILGLGDKAGIEDIKRAYKHLARHHHPDKNHKSEATREFQKISDAYSNLLCSGEESLTIDDDEEAVAQIEQFLQFIEKHPEYRDKLFEVSKDMNSGGDQTSKIQESTRYFSNNNSINSCLDKCNKMNGGGSHSSCSSASDEPVQSAVISGTDGNSQMLQDDEDSEEEHFYDTETGTAEDMEDCRDEMEGGNSGSDRGIPPDSWHQQVSGTIQPQQNSVDQVSKLDTRPQSDAGDLDDEISDKESMHSGEMEREPSDPKQGNTRSNHSRVYYHGSGKPDSPQNRSHAVQSNVGRHHTHANGSQESRSGSDGSDFNSQSEKQRTRVENTGRQRSSNHGPAKSSHQEGFQGRPRTQENIGSSKFQHSRGGFQNRGKNYEKNGKFEKRFKGNSDSMSAESRIDPESHRRIDIYSRKDDLPGSRGNSVSALDSPENALDRSNCRIRVDDNVESYAVNDKLSRIGNVYARCRFSFPEKGSINMLDEFDEVPALCQNLKVRDCFDKISTDVSRDQVESANRGLTKSISVDEGVHQFSKNRDIVQRQTMEHVERPAGRVFRNNCDKIQVDDEDWDGDNSLPRRNDSKRDSEFHGGWQNEDGNEQYDEKTDYDVDRSGRYRQPYRKFNRGRGSYPASQIRKGYDQNDSTARDRSLNGHADRSYVNQNRDEWQDSTDNSSRFGFKERNRGGFSGRGFRREVSQAGGGFQDRDTEKVPLRRQRSDDGFWAEKTGGRGFDHRNRYNNGFDRGGHRGAHRAYENDDRHQTEGFSSGGFHKTLEFHRRRSMNDQGSRIPYRKSDWVPPEGGAASQTEELWGESNDDGEDLPNPDVARMPPCNFWEERKKKQELYKEVIPKTQEEEERMVIAAMEESKRLEEERLTCRVSNMTVTDDISMPYVEDIEEQSLSSIANPPIHDETSVDVVTDADTPVVGTDDQLIDDENTASEMENQGSEILKDSVEEWNTVNRPFWIADGQQSSDGMPIGACQADGSAQMSEIYDLEQQTVEETTDGVAPAPNPISGMNGEYLIFSPAGAASGDQISSDFTVKNVEEEEEEESQLKRPVIVSVANFNLGKKLPLNKGWGDQMDEEGENNDAKSSGPFQRNEPVDSQTHLTPVKAPPRPTCHVHQGVQTSPDPHQVSEPSYVSSADSSLPMFSCDALNVEFHCNSVDSLPTLPYDVRNVEMHPSTHQQCDAYPSHFDNRQHYDEDSFCASSSASIPSSYFYNNEQDALPTNDVMSEMPGSMPDDVDGKDEMSQSGGNFNSMSPHDVLALEDGMGHGMLEDSPCPNHEMPHSMGYYPSPMWPMSPHLGHMPSYPPVPCHMPPMCHNQHFWPTPYMQYAPMPMFPPTTSCFGPAHHQLVHMPIHPGAMIPPQHIPPYCVPHAGSPVPCPCPNYSFGIPMVPHAGLMPSFAPVNPTGVPDDVNGCET